MIDPGKVMLNSWAVKGVKTVKADSVKVLTESLGSAQTTRATIKQVPRASTLLHSCET